MKRSALGLLGVLLLGGCADSGEDAAIVTKKSPARNTATESPAAEKGSPLDAERLLASALASAKADDKRVMVHLGATW